MRGTGLLSLLLAVLLATPEITYSFYFIEGEEPEGVIVQMFEWNFEDIAHECERFLGPKGFAGVQVSPITEPVVLNGRPWKERYQPVSYKIVSRSGDEEQFKDMVRRCNAAQVKVYVEVVLNHMSKSYEGPVRTFAGSDVDLVNYNYEAIPYSKEHFHKPCNITDENDAIQVRNCELDGLHDLDQSKAYVRCVMSDFLNKLIEYGVAGFCIESAKHMWPKDLKQISNRLNFLNHYEGFAYLAPPFIYQEVVEGGAIKSEEYYQTGYVTDYKYGAHVSQVFQKKKKMEDLKEIGAEGSPFVKADRALVFIDNHLTERGLISGIDNSLSYKQEKEYKLALIFMLAWPYGLPKILSSYEFSTTEQGPPASRNSGFANTKIGRDVCGKDWLCQHRWKEVYSMVEFRRLAQYESVTHWWDNGKDRFAFGRGTEAFIVFNLDNDDRMKEKKLKTGMEPGEYCDAINGEINEVGFCSGVLVSVKKNGVAKFTVNKMSAVAIHPGMKVPWKNTTPAVMYDETKKAAASGMENIEKATETVKVKAKETMDKAKSKLKNIFGGKKKQ